MDFSRDDCDSYAVESQKTSKKKLGMRAVFKNSIVPVKDPARGYFVYLMMNTCDQKTNMQSLGSLNPSFEAMGKNHARYGFLLLCKKYPELESIKHVHHAGNSSGIVDGAAAVLIGTKEMGEALGLKSQSTY